MLEGRYVLNQWLGMRMKQVEEQNFLRKKANFALEID